MNKQEITELVNNLLLPPDEYILLNNAALVIRGLSKHTNDLDLCVTKKNFNYIKEKFFVVNDEENTYHFIFNDKNIKIVIDDKGKVKFDIIDNLRVQDLNEILDLKIKNNNIYEQDDIASICEYLNIELRDLYDKDRNLTGKRIRKGDEVPEGLYYNTVAVYIQNEQGDFLIQKRSFSKGGKWATTGGHPKMGEDSVTGLCSEVKEEIGIDIDRENLKLIKSIRTKDDFFDLYYIKMEINLDDVLLQKEEVDDVKWSSISEINAMIDNGEYKTSHGMMFKDCMLFLEKKNK